MTVLPDGMKIEVGAVKLRAEDGRVYFFKDERFYDADGNHVDKQELRGALLGGKCGHPTCFEFNARWRDSSLKGKLVCDGCAAEKNDRAMAMRMTPPCERVE
jgi:hypothetical protein